MVWVCDRWKMVYPMLGFWMEADAAVVVSSRVQSRVQGHVASVWFFHGNGFASGKLLWRSEKLLISDRAASSSGDVVICLLSLWQSLRWCRRRRIGASFLHRFILSFQFSKVGMYVAYNLIYLINENTYAMKKKYLAHIHVESPRRPTVFIES
jgi:hypothetical protein